MRKADRCEDLRRERSSIPLPRLVAVRKDGPGEACQVLSRCESFAFSMLGTLDTGTGCYSATGKNAMNREKTET